MRAIDLVTHVHESLGIRYVNVTQDTSLHACKDPIATSTLLVRAPAHARDSDAHSLVDPIPNGDVRNHRLTSYGSSAGSARSACRSIDLRV